MYKAAPAEPILASSLLARRTASEVPASASAPAPDSASDYDNLHPRTHAAEKLSSTSAATPAFRNWDLTYDINQGLHAKKSTTIDNDNNNELTGCIFRPGIVIGFSALRGSVPDGGDGDEFVGELPRYLLTNWLRRQARTNPSATSSPKAKAKAYIIHPQSCTVFSPQALLNSLISESKSQPRVPNNSTIKEDGDDNDKPSPPLTRQEAISLLDTVTLYPVFDFTDAVDALGVVEGELHSLSSSSSSSGTAEEPETSAETNTKTKPETETLLILAGLDTLTESIVRSSNAVRGAALLGTLLRTVTGLSRSYSCGSSSPFSSPSSVSLSTMVVNLSGVGPAPYQRYGQSSYGQGQLQPQNETGDNGSAATSNSINTSTITNSGGGIKSMFPLSGVGGGIDTPLFPSLLMKTLDSGIDTHLLVLGIGGGAIGGVGAAGKAGRERVIEVVKDRVGMGLGRWCVWPPSGDGLGGVVR